MARPKKEKTVATANKEEKLKAPKAIGPYDIIKLMFTDINGFDKLSNNILDRNAFMINRVFSIQFPQQAQCFNNTGINNADVVKSWRLFAVKTLGFGKVPGFVYTKGAGRTSEMKAKDNITKDIKELYCKHYQISLTDFEDTLELYHDELIQDIQIFSENIKQINAIQKG